MGLEILTFGGFEATSAGIYSKQMAGENEISLDALGTTTAPTPLRQCVLWPWGAAVAVSPMALRGN